MEKEIKIRTPDKHIIYGTLSLAKRKSSTLLVFVHGLTGHQNEHIFYNGARYFSERGINTFRFDLYTSEKGGRVLTKCGISTHAEDLNTVVKYFRKKFKKIFVAGHSLGGLTIQASNADLVDGIIFWDSARSLKGVKGAGFKFIKALDLYLIRWGTEILMGKKMNRERNNFPLPNEIMPRIHTPIKIIVAGKGTVIKTGRAYYKYANKPKEFAIVKGAGHNFNEEGVAEKLFAETYSFIKKFT
ncbi:MAG: alpha/beta fold hydrolase [Candidatus Colwellbacteria bacterium]